MRLTKLPPTHTKGSSCCQFEDTEGTRAQDEPNAKQSYTVTTSVNV